MGAANDPRAPYNEPQEPECEVRVREVLVKETTVFGVETIQCCDYDIDPDTGRRVAVPYTEQVGDVSEAFRDQQLTAREIIEACGKICRQLTKDGHRWYAGLNVYDLLSDCDGWDTEELEVSEAVYSKNQEKSSDLIEFV